MLLSSPWESLPLRWLLGSLYFARVRLVQAAHNVSIDDTDPRWTYSPPVCADYCDGLNGTPQGWWQLANQRNATEMEGFYQLTETATNLIGATASMQFNGIAIYYYGNTAYYGARMLLTLDGQQFIVDTNNSAPAEHRQTLVWWNTGLNGSQTHSFEVKKQAGDWYIDVDRVDITVEDTTSSASVSLSTSLSVSESSLVPSGSGGNSQSNTVASVQSQSSSDPAQNAGPTGPNSPGTTTTITAQSNSIDTGTIAGAAVGGAAVLGLMILAAAIIMKKRRDPSQGTQPTQPPMRPFAPAPPPPPIAPYTRNLLQYHGHPFPPNSYPQAPEGAVGPLMPAPPPPSQPSAGTETRRGPSPVAPSSTTSASISGTLVSGQNRASESASAPPGIISKEAVLYQDETPAAEGMMTPDREHQMTSGHARWSIAPSQDGERTMSPPPAYSRVSHAPDT